MSKTVQWKRGNANVSSSYTGPVGEITVNTDDWSLRVHDGATAGGWTIDSNKGGDQIGNLSIVNQTITGTVANANIFLEANGTGRIYANNIVRSTGLRVGETTNADITSFRISSTATETYIGTGTQAPYNGNIQISANTAYPGINISKSSGKMGFNASPDATEGGGYTFDFNGSMLANVYYADPNNAGYSFALPGGDTGLKHEVNQDGLSELVLQHENRYVAKFIDNGSIVFDGDLTISTGNNEPYGDTFPDAPVKMFANVDSYAQIVLQNISSNSSASSDFVATADNGSDESFYIDVGVNSSNYFVEGWFDDMNTSNDGYVVVVGANISGPGDTGPGNLIVGTTSGVVKTFVGNASYANIVTVVSTTGLEVRGNTTAEYFIGNGSLLTGITSNYSDANVAAFLAAFGSNSINTTGNINANINASYVRANGLYGTATNDTAFLSNASGLIRVLVQNNGINIQTYDHPNLNYHTWTFNSAGDLYLPSSNGGIYRANGQPYGGTDNYSNANVAAYLPVYSGNISSGNIIVEGNVTASDVTATTMRSSFRTYANTAVFGYGTDGSGLIGAPICITGNSTQSVIFTTGLANNVASNLTVKTLNSNISLQISGEDKTWVFDTTGNLTAPGNITTTGNISVGNILAQNIRTIEGTVHIGQGAGLTDQGSYSIAVGRFAATTNQGNLAVAVGYIAGQTNQGDQATAIGYYTATTDQSANAVAIGTYAGRYTQGVAAVAIGTLAGNSVQGSQAIAIGSVAGQSNQGTDAVAIGTSAGGFNQREGAVAIGQSAGVIDQGVFAVAIGSGAGYQYQANNSIAITATGTQLSPEQSGFYVDPVREDVGNIGTVAFYNINTKEFTYSNTISINGNITGGNLSTTGNVVGNVNGYSIGYRDIPQVTFTSNATLALTDAGKHYYSANSANVITIPNNSTVSFNIGAAISIVQQGTANLTIVPDSGVTLYLAGNSTSGSRTLGNYGMATLMKVATDTWFINGTGVA